MSEAQTTNQTTNPIEEYKKIVNERLRKAENLKGIAQAVVADLINFLKTNNVATWGLGITALNESYVVASFKAESRDPSVKIELFHIDSSIDGKVTNDVEARIWTSKDTPNELKFVVEFKRTE